MATNRTARSRTDHCCICGAAVQSASTTTDHPEAPEMIQLPPGVWCGLVQDETDTLLVVCCSDACVDRLLVE